jgi:hypothetical protein
MYADYSLLSVILGVNHHNRGRIILAQLLEHGKSGVCEDGRESML